MSMTHAPDMLIKKAFRGNLIIFLCFGLLFCVSSTLKGQSTLLFLQSQTITSQGALGFTSSMNYSFVFQNSYQKMVFEKAICSRVLGKNLVLQCPKHDLLRDIKRISKHLDSYRKFKSKCGRVNYKINDDNFTIKINLNRLSTKS